VRQSQCRYVVAREARHHQKGPWRQVVLLLDQIKLTEDFAFEEEIVRLLLPPNSISEFFTLADEDVNGVCRDVHSGERVSGFICHLDPGHLGMSLITR